MTGLSPGRQAGGAGLCGIAWMTAASLFFAAGYLPVRELSDRFNAVELVFYRALLTVLLMLPWLIRAGLPALKTDRLGLYVLRGATTFVGMVCLFYGLANMKLANATALTFTAPLFTIVIGAAVLGDRVGRGRWWPVLIGFAGGLIIIRPGFTDLSWPVLAVVVTAITYGVSNALMRTEGANAVVFYMFATIVPFAAAPALISGTIPEWSDAPWILALGAATYMSQQCITRSLGNAAAAIVMPAYYLQLPLVAAIAFAAYGEVPVIWVWVGAAVICASTYYILRLENKN
ncbi:MAG: DMT family transporter [Rhodospirillales bacterium]|nr:DMT family transporter [Rhodospirillales bacterium]